MKTISRILCATAILLAAKSSNAQSPTETATANVSATIVQPITITKTVDMSFGNVAVRVGTGGTVVLAPGGSRTTGGAGGVTLPATPGTVAAASFTVSGDANRTFVLTLPSSTTLSDGGTPSHSMTVNTFTSNLTNNTDGTLSNGSATVNVGATLNVSANQFAGNYTGTFSVTVNYN